jgi:hypothetical protein
MVPVLTEKGKYNEKDHHYRFGGLHHPDDDRQHRLGHEFRHADPVAGRPRRLLSGRQPSSIVEFTTWHYCKRQPASGWRCCHVAATIASPAHAGKPSFVVPLIVLVRLHDQQSGAGTLRSVQRVQEVVPDCGHVFRQKPAGTIETSGAAEMNEFGMFRHGSLHRYLVGELDSRVPVAGLK